MSENTTPTASAAVTLHAVPTFIPLDFFLSDAAVADPATAAAGTLTVADPTIASATLGTMTAEWATAKVPAGTLGGIFSALKGGSTTASYTDGSLTASLSLFVPSADAVTWDVADAVIEASSTGTTASSTGTTASAT